MNLLFQNQHQDFADYGSVAGVDEAGRGPIAGPLVVAAVVLRSDAHNDTLNDSKKLSERQREGLYEWIINNAVDYDIQIVSVEDIDRLNILQATLYGMKLCIQALRQAPDVALIDGNHTPKGLNIHLHAVVKGDSKYACIAAASILAKVTRDRLMLELDKQYPQYQLASHKGYPTKLHLEMLRAYRVSPIHRRTYKPVSDIIKLVHSETIYSIR